MSPIEQTRAFHAPTMCGEHDLETKMASSTFEQERTRPAGADSASGVPAEHTFAHSIDPDAEEAYWRENYARRPYVTRGDTFNEYRPAYRYGVDAHRRFDGRPFDEVASELARDWNRVKGTSSLTWENAEHAARDAWQRVRDFVDRAGK
jgi:hypothetical protein